MTGQVERSKPRYAVYFAPPSDSALWTFGCAALGYDAATRKEVEPLPVPGISRGRWLALTEAPRQYGFHATLKAPFLLREGASEDDLLAAAESLARTERRFEIAGLKVSAISAFLALTPAIEDRALNDFAFRVVRHFEPLRAPLTAFDLERRLAGELTLAQRENLNRYGYPYVGEEFYFHMTLTGSLAASEQSLLHGALTGLFAKAAPAGRVAIDAVTVFKQDDRRQRFYILARLPLSSIA